MDSGKYKAIASRVNKQGFREIKRLKNEFI